MFIFQRISSVVLNVICTEQTLKLSLSVHDMLHHTLCVMHYLIFNFNPHIFMSLNQNHTDTDF